MVIQVVRNDWVFREGEPTHDRYGRPNVDYKQVVNVFHTESEYRSCVEALEFQAAHDAANGAGNGTIDSAWYNPIVISKVRLRMAIDELKWEDDPGYDIWWGDQKDAHGLLHGSCFYYGGHASGNWPYPIVQRSDGKVAFPPTDEGNPFSASEWVKRLNGNA